MELVFSGHRVSVEEDKNILELHGGDGCITVNVLNVTGLYT